MARCPGCRAELPPFSLHCVECGRALLADTVQEQERLQPPALDSRTLVGGPWPGGGKTVREGEIELPLPDAALAGATDPDALPVALSPPPSATDEPAPSLVRLDDSDGVAVRQPPDQGEPARRRSEEEPAVEPETLEGVPSPAPEERTDIDHDPEAGGEMTAPEDRRPDPLPQIAELVEGYEIISEVGRGGMGRVYRARHRLTGQDVALKMLLPKFSRDPRLRGRFLNEAKVLARLEHPNLVPLLGFIEAAERAFIVMPFVRGITLERMLRRQGRLPEDVALDLFEQVCEAIAHVHAHKVLHRDLKPSNVIVRSDGRVLVTDFGIARAIGSDRITMTGMVVGTAEYLAPEQACGEVRDDLRSDIYALGILLYEMLTGRVPFRHESPAEVLQRQVSAPPPPPRTIVPELSEAMEAALLKALEKKPADRFQTVGAFRSAVRAAARAGGASTPSVRAERTSDEPPTRPGLQPARVSSTEVVAPRSGSPRRVLWRTVGLLAIAAVGLVVWYALAGT